MEKSSLNVFFKPGWSLIGLSHERQRFEFHSILSAKYRSKRLILVENISRVDFGPIAGRIFVLA